MAAGTSAVPAPAVAASGPPAWTLLAIAAVAVPALIAFNQPPSATFLNQAAALGGWALWLLWLAGVPAAPGALRGAGPAALLAALGLLAAAALASPWWTGLPTTLSLSALALLAAAALTAAVAVRVQHAGHGAAAFEAFCRALLLAGVLSALIGALQVYAPDWTDGHWIARAGHGDRAGGNLRQPNHLSSLLMWAMIAAAWLADTGRLPRRPGYVLQGLLLFALMLTGSRTGMLGTGLLALWGLLDRSLTRRTRALLLLTPVVFALFWFGAAAWAHLNAEVFVGDAQIHKSDISSSRFGIWSNTLALIAAHPWAGVGFGEFNFAWTLTPFPGRPVAFFDHTHNLPLHLVVELGLPLAALVLALLLWALHEAWRNAQAAGGDAPDPAPPQRAALMMVLMIALHSLLEYPLWYSYFLLPASFAFGLCLGRVAAPAAAGSAPPPRIRPLKIAALLLLFGSLASLADYRRVVVIFAPSEGAAPLTQRIMDGRGSVFFGHHADYAATTIATHPSEVLPAFQRATHYLLDTRLMMAWANALAEIGETDRARWLAQRLREFHNPQSEEFFAACAAARPASQAQPYQCELPRRTYDFRDFQ